MGSCCVQKPTGSTHPTNQLCWALIRLYLWTWKVEFQIVLGVSQNTDFLTTTKNVARTTLSSRAGQQQAAGRRLPLLQGAQHRARTQGGQRRRGACSALHGQRGHSWGSASAGEAGNKVPFPGSPGSAGRAPHAEPGLLPARPLWLLTTPPLSTSFLASIRPFHLVPGPRNLGLVPPPRVARRCGQHVFLASPRNPEHAHQSPRPGEALPRGEMMPSPPLGVESVLPQSGTLDSESFLRSCLVMWPQGQRGASVTCRLNSSYSLTENSTGRPWRWWATRNSLTDSF